MTTNIRTYDPIPRAVIFEQTVVRQSDSRSSLLHFYVRLILGPNEIEVFIVK